MKTAKFAGPGQQNQVEFAAPVDAGRGRNTLPENVLCHFNETACGIYEELRVFYEPFRNEQRLSVRQLRKWCDRCQRDNLQTRPNPKWQFFA